MSSVVGSSLNRCQHNHPEGSTRRTVIVCNIMSLDGRYEGPGGNVMALNMDAAFDAYNLERIRSALLLRYAVRTGA